MLPLSSYDRNVQSVYVPDEHGGRLYVVLTRCKFCFCTPGDTPIKWHIDLPFVPYDHSLLNHFAEYTLTVYGSNLVVIGGTLTGRPINLVWSLNSKRNKWEKLPSMLTKRSSVMAVSYGTVGGDHLVAAGGKCGDKICVDVEVFDGKDWTKVKPLPMDLKSPNELTSVLHTDKKWYLVTSFSVAVAVDKKAKILCGQLSNRCTTCRFTFALKMTRASSRNVGKLYTDY